VTEGEISRTATVSWFTGPPRGLGRISVGSKAFAPLPFSFTYEEAKEATTPGELLAAAHSAGFAMTLARLLERDRLSVRELIVDGTYTFAGEWFEIEAVSFRVQGRVDGAESNAFERAAREALERCAESHWLRPGEVELRAKLL
jgi:lipoyl-dependent peroxiredoxin